MVGDPAAQGARLRLARGGPEDVDAVWALLDEAARWLTARGVEQWRPGALPRAVVEADARRGGLRLLRAVADGGERDVLAAAWAVADADPEIWPAVSSESDAALYLHRLVVARAWAGRGLGDRALAAASREAASRGRGWLRLDCQASNAALRAWYARRGFREAGEVRAWGTALARYELPVGPDPRAAPGPSR